MPWRARKVVFQEFKFLDFVLNRRQSVVGVFVSFGVVRCEWLSLTPWVWSPATMSEYCLSAMHVCQLAREASLVVPDSPEGRPMTAGAWQMQGYLN